MFRGVAQLVARGVWDAEVASSSLVAPTIQGGKIKKTCFLYLTDAEWKDFRDSGKLTIIKYCDYLYGRFLFVFSLIELVERPKG